MSSQFRSRKLRAQTAGSRRFFKLACERLEDRSLLAVLFGATGGSVNSNLYMIDTATGATTSIGAIGFAVTGLAIDPISGTLFGSTSNQSPNSPNSIITIDKTTGVGTLVGAVGLGNEEVADLTFDAAGTLYGWTEIYTDDLVTINTATGAATKVGEAGLVTFGSGLADVGGTLYYSGNGIWDGAALRTVDKTTGATTVVATLHGGPSNTDGIAALAVNPDNGTLFGVALNDSDVVHPAYLITINIATGQVTTIGALPNDFDAIAFDNPPPGYPNLGPGSSFVVSDPFNPGSSILLVRGTAGNDNIVLDRVNTTTMLVTLNGVATSFVYNTFQKIVVIAEAGHDVVAVRASVDKPAELFGDEGNDQLSGGRGHDILHGGDGNDRLSGGAGHDVLYGEVGNDNLAGGTGDDFAFGGSGADQLSGDVGNDVLLGEEGNDGLKGGAGRDLLIGGLGADKLQGEAHDDILIGGTTSHDDNAVALAAILLEWVSPRSYTARVANIGSGAKTGGFALNSGTVQDDGAADLLTGLAGQNWFFAGIGDRITDKAPGRRR
jgi:Ca2+-binding RTX toxin-like protein